jgi:hypothetical protein
LLDVANHPPEKLLGRNFIEKISPTGNKQNSEGDEVFFHSEDEEGVDLLKSSCKVGTCMESCFKLFHTQGDLLTYCDG